MTRLLTILGGLALAIALLAPAPTVAANGCGVHRHWVARHWVGGYRDRWGHWVPAHWVPGQCVWNAHWGPNGWYR